MSTSTAPPVTPTRAPRVWRPCPSAGGQLGFGACLVLLVVALGASAWTANQPISLGLFLGLVVALMGLIASVLVAAWTYGYYTLRYELDADGLTVSWLYYRQHLPYRSIEAVYGGQRLVAPLPMKGITWPGYYVGRGRARNLGVLRVFATAREGNALTLVLSDLGGFALSPDASFRTALIERLEWVRQTDAPLAAPAAGPPAGKRERAVPSVRRRQFHRALSDSWLVGCALLGLVGLLAMLGYIMERYETLPHLLPPLGAPLGDMASVRPRFDLFHLPGVASLVLGLDIAIGVWLHAREPLAARLIWATPLLIEGVLFVALVRTIG